MTWLWHLLGFDYGLPYGHVGWYNMWSGFGSDVGEVVIIGGLIQMFRKHNCHQQGCWRIGKHQVDGSPWCSRHHEAARASAAVAPPADDTGARLAKLSEDISGLADAIRTALPAAGPQTVTVNVPPSADPVATARAIQKMLLDLKRKRGGGDLGLS